MNKQENGNYYDEYYSENSQKEYLENWLSKNVYYRVDELVESLEEDNKITTDSFDNFYKEINDYDYSTTEEYEAALNNREPQDVYKWYLITEEAYFKFKDIGYPVLRYKELYIWGRIYDNDNIITDFIDDEYSMKKIFN